MRRIYVGDGGSFVWQWQPKEQIVLEGYPEGVFVHYANCDTVEAPVVQSRMESDKLVADIPPELMQSDKDITVYVCDVDGTKHCHFLSVLSRPKPESYVTEPVEVLRYESLAERVTALEKGGSGGGGGITEEKDPTVPAWAKQPQKPTYTAEEVGAMPKDAKIPGRTSELTNDAGFVNKAVKDLTNYYTKTQTQELIAAIPRFRVTVVQQLPAAGEELVLYLVPFATAEGQYLEYIWVDGRWEIIGSQRVDLTGYATEEWVQDYVAENSGQNLSLDDTLTQSGKAADAKAVGDALDELEEKIPSIKGLAKTEDIPKVPNWAMQSSKPSYAASEVGADPKGTAAAAVSAHNTNNAAHNDIRQELAAINARLTAFFNSDNQTLDELSEIVAYITSNKSLIDAITTSKVSVADIVNNLTTNVANKPLSAAQGVILKDLIDGLSSGKLDASKLTESINTALAQAKANGEFDGKNGDPGVSPTVAVSAITGGHRISITDKDGTKTATVTNGKDGDDGYTPQRGKDYWTPTDKAEIEAYITAALAKYGQLQFEFAESLEWLKANGDTTKLYILPDLFIYAYRYQEATGPSYTNVAGTITYDKRLSSSGKVSSSAMAGACYTDFIPVKKGQIVRIKNLDVYTNFSSSAFPYVCFYTGASENNVVSSTIYARPSEFSDDFVGAQASVNGDVVTWEAFLIGSKKQHPLADEITHIRISGKYFADREVIVTVDEEITEGSSGGYAWANTGRALIPADYEDEILALKQNKADKTAIPTKLPNPNALTIDGVEYDGSATVNIETKSGGNILYGKKWVACGDSFTANGYNASDGFDESVYIYQDGRFAGRYKVYPNIIGLRNNMDVVNLATGGQTMAQSSNSFMTRYATIPADADYITIMLGINDKVQGIPVGAIDSIDTATFCGAFNVAMEHILENHPFAHIGIMVSHGTNEEIMEATRGIAERWGVPYLDYGSPQVPLMNRYTGRNVCAKAQEIRERNFCVISDGTTPTNAHPNTAAHEYESTFIESWLRTL